MNQSSADTIQLALKQSSTILWLLVLTFDFVEESFSEVKQVQFNREVRAILPSHCFACHEPVEKERKAKLRFSLTGIEHEKLAYRYRGRDFRLTEVKGRVDRKILV